MHASFVIGRAFLAVLLMRGFYVRACIAFALFRVLCRICVRRAHHPQTGCHLYRRRAVLWLVLQRRDRFMPPGPAAGGRLAVGRFSWSASFFLAPPFRTRSGPTDGACGAHLCSRGINCGTLEAGLTPASDLGRDRCLLPTASTLVTRDGV